MNPIKNESINYFSPQNYHQNYHQEQTARDWENNLKTGCQEPSTSLDIIHCTPLIRVWDIRFFRIDGAFLGEPEQPIWFFILLRYSFLWFFLLYGAFSEDKTMLYIYPERIVYYFCNNHALLRYGQKPKPKPGQSFPEAWKPGRTEIGRTVTTLCVTKLGTEMAYTQLTYNKQLIQIYQKSKK